jgi:DNA invertase Pin-like site-specific DNA recombinase
MTGTCAERLQLKKLMAKLDVGDAVIILAVNRLSRETTDLLVIAHDIARRSGLALDRGACSDTIVDSAGLVLAMLGVAEKLERRKVLERTARGRADATATGIVFGRKPKLTQHRKREARARIEAGETQRNVARSYNVSQSTIARLQIIGAACG